MRLEKFKTLKVGDKIKYEHSHWENPLIGIIEETRGINVRVNAPETKDRDSCSHNVSPRQIICKIVKKKKPLLQINHDLLNEMHLIKEENQELKEQLKKYDGLDFFGYAQSHYGGILGMTTEQRAPRDTHEVWIRPIK